MDDIDVCSNRLNVHQTQLLQVVENKKLKLIKLVQTIN